MKGQRSGAKRSIVKVRLGLTIFLVFKNKNKKIKNCVLWGDIFLKQNYIIITSQGFKGGRKRDIKYF